MQLPRAGEKITVIPSSKELLFYPPEVEATITGGRSLLTLTYKCVFLSFSLLPYAYEFFFTVGCWEEKEKSESIEHSDPGTPSSL